jgi:hypothetical protein
MPAIAASVTLAAALCFVRVPFFPTPSDAVHLGVSLAMTAYAAYNDQNAADVCMYALVSLSDAIYRTPETPYASIICLLLAISLWTRAITMTGVAKSTNEKVDFMCAMLYTVFTAEAAMVPQFDHPEDWPIYGGTAVYVTFAIAWLQHTSKPPSAEITPLKHALDLWRVPVSIHGAGPRPDHPAGIGQNSAVPVPRESPFK